MKTIKNISVRFRAKCTALKIKTHLQNRPIVKNMRPNLLMKGNYCISLIEECEPPIFQGESGEVLITSIIIEDDLKNFLIGSKFELRDGPRVSMAHCEIISEVEILED